MKKWILVLLLTLPAGILQAQVKFETSSTDAVRAMATKANKLVFIDLYASWCPPCRMMERDVFSRQDVGEFMDARFVCAKYDVDKSLGKDLLARYAPNKAIPTYLIFNTEGDLLGRIQGGASPEEFMGEVQQILNKQEAR